MIARIFPWQRGKGGQISKVDYLQRVDVFKDLGMEEVKRFGEKLPMRTCTSGTLFYSPEDPTERLFILKEGQVELYRLTAHGKKIVTRRLGPGRIFGEMGLLGQSMQGEFAEATEDVLVCVATREEVLRILRGYPDVAVRLLEAVGSRLKQLEDRFEHATFSTVPVRLADFLLTNGEAKGGLISGFTQAEIGDTIGALRQTVTETLSEWKHEGLIEVGHRQVRILDWGRLKEIASR